MTSNNLLSRMSLGSNGFHLPLRTSSQSPRSSTDYDLEELSPRPSSPLISSHPARASHSPDFPARYPNNSSRWKGKGKAVAYADQEDFPPMSVVDRMRLYREARTASAERERQGREEWKRRQVPSWRPPSPSDPRSDGPAHSRTSSFAQQASFMGSMFLGRSKSTTDASVTDIDTTFRTFATREHQLQKELQKLLDAQSAAIERGHDEASNETSRAGSITPRSGSPQQYRRSDGDGDSVAPKVIPVRQPKKKPPSLRHVRDSITRAIVTLADLKAEEDAYILSALSSRQTALVKANKLSKQHRAITGELHSIEESNADPLSKEINIMEDEYARVCEDIQSYEEQLRALKRSKAHLERRLEEAKSERESGLSGYRGALKETERSIGEMMRRPGIKVLDIDGFEENEAQGSNSTNEREGDRADDESKVSLMERRLTGQEFLGLRPERRTLAMAKEWWEGEAAVLKRRRETVDRERLALEEGSEVWAEVVHRTKEYEARLANALNESITIEHGTLSLNSERERQEKTMFKRQYRDLRETLDRLKKSMSYVEEKGWNLLVAAIGAEIEGFMEGERILRSMMQSKGLDVDRDLEPLFVPATDQQRSNDTGQTVQEQQPELEHDALEELTGSVVRRWAGEAEDTNNEDTNTKDRREPPSSQEHRDERDNEVPPDLLTAVADNEVPAEFLSMHNDTAEDKSIDSRDDNEVPKDLMAETALT